MSGEGEVVPSNSADGLGARQRWAIFSTVFAVAFLARLLASSKVPFNADEAVQGIAALDLLQHGRIGLFYPGQAYGGMLEVLIQAPLQLFSPGDVALLRLPIELLNAASCGLFALLLWSVLRSRGLALFGGLLAAVAPTSFVVMGSFFGSGYASGTFCATAGLLLVVPFLDRPRLRYGLAPATLFLLAGYSQPIVLMLIVPALLMILTLRLPSIWRLEAAQVAHGKFSRLLIVRVLLVLLPMFVVIIAQKVVSSVQVANGTAFDPADVKFKSFQSLKIALGLGTWPNSAPDLSPMGINEPPTWLLFDFNHLNRTFASVASSITWAVILLGALTFIGVLFVREPSARIAKLGAAALGLACLGGLVAVYGWVLPSYGRYGYSGSLVVLFAVVLVVSLAGDGTRLWVSGGVLALAVTLLLVDLLASGSQASATEQLERVATELSASEPLVGDYWEVYPAQFLRADGPRAIPLQVNRFPEDLANLPEGGRTTVLMLMPALNNSTRLASEAVQAACREISQQDVGGRLLLTLDCPNKVLKKSAAPAFR